MLSDSKRNTLKMTSGVDLIRLHARSAETVSPSRPRGCRGCRGRVSLSGLRQLCINARTDLLNKPPLSWTLMDLRRLALSLSLSIVSV